MRSAFVQGTDRACATSVRSIHGRPSVNCDRCLRFRLESTPRRKSEVLTQLPQRTDKNVFVPMTAEQMRLHDENGDKADELAALLEDLFEYPEAKVVVFSAWLGTHELIQRRLAARGWDHVFFNGSVPSEQRHALVDRFRNEPACRVFLSTDAGGVGLSPSDSRSFRPLFCASCFLSQTLRNERNHQSVKRNALRLRSSRQLGVNGLRDARDKFARCNASTVGRRYGKRLCLQCADGRLERVLSIFQRVLNRFSI